MTKGKAEKLLNINYALSLLITVLVAKYVKHVNITNVTIPLFGISAMYLVHKKKRSGFILLLIQTIIYSSVAIRYSLVGEYYSNMIICTIGNIVLLIKTYMVKWNIIELGLKKKSNTKIFIFIQYALIIGTFVLLSNWFDNIGSLFPNLESINAILLFIGFKEAWNLHSERYLFWLTKGFISLYIWVKVEDRIFCIIFFSFYCINYLILLLKEREKINFKKDID